MKLPYRADIDGLRAVAVLSVVLFHADFHWFSGGFVGVDIFFVISGYLITGIIVRELEAGSFSILRFYERRIRRIFPALFTVLGFTLACGALLFGAKEFRELGESAAAATFFVSNILFFSEAGYFDAPSELKPLLHTWSLAVEEQYYIFFPPLLMVIARYLKSRYITVLALVSFISLGIGLYEVKNSPAAAFYLAHGRVWELLVGSMIAVGVLPTPSNSESRNVLSFLGLVMIVLSVGSFGQNTTFPGVAALLPTLGSALIIYSGTGGESLVGKALGCRPAVFLGLISYSLYLWHWPLIVFTKYFAIRKLAPWEMALLLCVTMVVSIASYQCIEKPTRSKNFCPSRRRLWGYAGGVMALTAACSASIYVHHGFPGKFGIKEAGFEEAAHKEWRRWKRCDDRAEGLATGEELCSIGARGREPSFLVWGDSHARSLAPGIQTSAVRAGVAGEIATMPSCPPLLGIERNTTKKCFPFNRMLLNYVSEHQELETIFLIGRWAHSAHGKPYKGSKGRPFRLVDVLEGRKENGIHGIFELGLKRTVEELLKLDRRVVLVDQVPEVGHHVPSAHGIARRTGREIHRIIAPTMEDYLERNQVVLDVFDKLRGLEGVQIVSPREMLCTNDPCAVALGEESLYLDDNHLSVFGARYISPLLDAAFAQ